MPTLITRFLQEKDYLPLAAIFNEIYLDRPTFSAEKVRAIEDQFPKHIFREFRVAELAGEVVAAWVLTQDQIFSHPGWYFFNIWVKPEFQQKGIGGEIYELLMERLSTLTPTQLQCGSPESSFKTIRFLEKRGFKESHGNFESRLELSHFIPDKYYGIETQLEKSGIKLQNLKDLKDPHHRQEIYNLQYNLEREIPGADQRPGMNFNDFWEKVDRDLPKGEFFSVAMKGEKYIGLHFGSCPPGSEWFMVRVTGVLPEFRKMGVATALKARGLEHAKKMGFPGAFTWNDSRNQPILDLNLKFGFQRQPATIVFSRKF
jgi:mycothiol synthase